MESAKMSHGQLVFGLDIGTRSVIGTVGYKNEDGSFVVVAQSGKEHETRAMLDGQIHDINKVSFTIRQVKEKLEKKLDHKLTKVCIAAAGRVLKTVQIHSEMEFEEEQLITEEEVYALQSQATEEAYKEFLQNDQQEMKFYCVGSSVVRYYMNDYMIGNLLEHKAKKIAVDMIATFLPDDVVDGLYRAVSLAGLDVVSLTLEPIAAIELAIPEKFRLLNIALVDVGAGTSDISITKEGTIVAFGMIPVAGDCLTEMIANYCLVDFKTAEQIKQDAGEMDLVTYEDILALPQTVKSEEIKNLLSSSVESMAEQVAKKILELNGDKSVGAVFVVGGGGKIPGYTEALAEKLNLAKERVALRGKEVMENIIFEDSDLEKNSLLVTPIGICLDFYKENHNFIYVSFNDTTVKLYNNDRVTVMDAAMQTDYKTTGLFPKSGRELNFTVNHKKRIVRGETGEPALIFVNDELANLHTVIKDHDIIRVVESTAGQEGVARIKDLAEFQSEITVYVNGTRVTIPKFPTANDVLVTEDYQICEGDKIEFLDYVTTRQIQEVMDLSIVEGSVCYVNNKVASKNTKVYENFEVNWNLSTGEFDYPSAGDDYFDDEDEELKVEENLFQNRGEDWQIEEMETSVVEENYSSDDRSLEEKSRENRALEEDSTEYGSIEYACSEQSSSDDRSLEEKSRENRSLEEDSLNGNEVFSKEIYVLVNGRSIKMAGKNKYIFVDIFNYIDFDLSKPQGEIITTINGRTAGYMEEIHGGDNIEVYWRK